MMQLKVMRSGLFYSGRTYAEGETVYVEDVHALILCASGDANVVKTEPDHAKYQTADMNVPKRKYVRRDLTS